MQVRSGSRAHGLETAESDEDTRGICVPIPEVLFGLTPFEQWESEGGDHVIYSLQKFARLALEGNPNIIETLFTDPSDHLYAHPLAQPLLAARHLFLSKQVGLRFGRYAIHQLKKIERHYRWLTQPAPTKPLPSAFGAVEQAGTPRFPDTAAERAYRAAFKHYRAYSEWRKNRNPKRALLEEQFGYDTKHAMHLCRLLNMGCEILSEGRVLVRRPDAEWLREVRSGRLGYGELLQWVNQRESDLIQAERLSPLPLQPDFSAAESLVVDITVNYLRS